jgi:uncharacterized protein (TIGR02594 family)
MKLFDVAKAHIGLKEVTGAVHNPKIAEFFAKAGHPQVKSDEISWCAAFVGACLVDAGMKGTGKLTARSYLDWGDPVELEDAQPGDIVVLWRGSPSSWQGHVGFFHSATPSSVKLIGGNQADAVNVTGYPKSRVLGVRRPKSIAAVVKPIVGHPEAGWFVGFINALLKPFSYFFGGKK